MPDAPRGFGCGASRHRPRLQGIVTEFRKGALQRYNSFRDKINADYASFLEQAWKDLRGEDTTQATLDANRRVEVFVMSSEQMIRDAKAQAGE